jgi:uncharacterized membrane protein YdjX (TVP38/TMEM64 family)
MSEDRKQQLASKKLWSSFAKLSLPAILIIALLFAFQNDSVRQTLFDIQTLRHLLRGGNIPGGIISSMAVFLFGFGTLIGVGMPRLWVSAIAGAIYGTLAGSGLALLATILGAVIIYKLGETFLSRLLPKRFRVKSEVYAQRFRENAFWWVLYIRLFPFSNASVTGILCGSCRVPFRAYLAGSALGFIPLTVVFAIFGSAGMTGSNLQIALGFALLVLSLAVRHIMNRSKNIRCQTPGTAIGNGSK